MTFATFTNLILVMLCIAVMVQSARMMRSFNSIRSGNLSDMVTQLDRATGQARMVLADLKTLLSTDGAANARAIASSQALRDELSVMVGIGNAVAERIMDAAAQGNVPAKVEKAEKPASKRAKAATPRKRGTRTTSTRRKAPAKTATIMSLVPPVPAMAEGA